MLFASILYVEKHVILIASNIFASIICPNNAVFEISNYYHLLL